MTAAQVTDSHGPARVADDDAEGEAFPRDVRGSKTEMHVAGGVAPLWPAADPLDLGRRGADMRDAVNIAAQERARQLEGLAQPSTRRLRETSIERYRSVAAGSGMIANRPRRTCVQRHRAFAKITTTQTIMMIVRPVLRYPWK